MGGYNEFISDFYTSTFSDYRITPFYWLSDQKIWFMYSTTTCTYNHVEVEEVQRVIMDFLEQRKIIPSNSLMKNCLAHTKIKTQKKFSDFAFMEAYMVKNAMIDCVNKKVIMIPQGARNHKNFNKKVTLYTNLTYDPKIRTPPPLYMKLSECFQFGKGIAGSSIKHPWRLTANQPTDEMMWHRMLKKYVWLDHSDQLLISLIGAPDAGKTPNIRVVEKLFKPMSESVVMSQLGENGAIDTALFKPFLIDGDNSMGFANDATVKLIKNNLTDGDRIRVKQFYKGWMSYPGGRFLLTACNQTFKFSEGNDTEGNYKRLCALFCCNKFKKDKKFMIKIQDQKFLDHLFSYLINLTLFNLEPYEEIVEGFTESEFYIRNEMMWRYSAYPVERICSRLFSRSKDPNDSEINAQVIINMVIEELIIEGYTEDRLPKNLGAKIKKCLGRQNIDWKRRSKSGNVFYPIKCETLSASEMRDINLDYTKQSTLESEFGM